LQWNHVLEGRCGMNDSSAMKTVKEIKSAIATLSLKEQISVRNWLNKQITTEEKRHRAIEKCFEEVRRAGRSRISLSEIVLNSRR